MYNKNKYTIILMCFLLFLFLMILPVLAENQCDPTKEVCLENPLPDTPTPQILIGKVINAVLGIVGSIALVMFIYGGFTWMTAAGNEQSVTKGKDILIWATVGLIVIFSAYALVRFVFQGIGATT